MSIVNNVAVYGIEDSFRRAKYPYIIDPDKANADFTDGLKKLAKSHKGEGHDQFLTGIIVQFDLTFSVKAWIELERYHFIDFISSQSTMHRITKFNVRDQYNDYVDPRVIEIMEEKIAQYNEVSELAKNIPADDKYNQERYANWLRQKYLEILYTNPAGFELTARLTTNYRCLLNIYIQRYDHRLPEWREFCQYIYDNLPMFKELVEAYNSGKCKI